MKLSDLVLTPQPRWSKCLNHAQHFETLKRRPPLERTQHDDDQDWRKKKKIPGKSSKKNGAKSTPLLWPPPHPLAWEGAGKDPQDKTLIIKPHKKLKKKATSLSPSSSSSFSAIEGGSAAILPSPSQTFPFFRKRPTWGFKDLLHRIFFLPSFFPPLKTRVSVLPNFAFFSK